MSTGLDSQTSHQKQCQSRWLEWCWVVLPILCVCAIGLLNLFEPVSQAPAKPPEPALALPLQVEATGREFEWWFRYPGKDTQLGTDDDIELRRDLQIPLNADVVVRVTSEDYVYTFLLNEAGIREIGVPDMWHTVTLHQTHNTPLDIPVDPLCAFRPLHDKNMGRLSVVDDARMRTLFGSATLAK